MGRRRKPVTGLRSRRARAARFLPDLFVAGSGQDEVYLLHQVWIPRNERQTEADFEEEDARALPPSG